MSASTEKKLRQAAREAGTDKKTLAQEKEAKERAKSKRRWTLGTIAVAVLIVTVLVLSSPLVYNATAYTVGDHRYSVGQTNFYYANQYNTFASQYGSYASLFGLDTSNGVKGLDKQDCPFYDGSWKDYFLTAAKNDMLQTTAVVDYANANGIALDADEIADVDANFDGLDEVAVAYGFANGDKMLAANYGTGVNQKVVREAYLNSALASKMLTQVSDSFTYTPAELEETYQSYEGSHDYFDYSYAYVAAVTVETTDENGESSAAATEETLAAAKATAEAIQAAYDKTEGEDYAARLTEAAAASGITANESDYVVGSSLGFAKEWLMDAARKAGDITVAEDSTGSGYYAVVFLNRDDNHYNTVSVRHILIEAEAGEDGTYSEEAKAAALARAEEILDEFNAGDKSEESFATLANLYSADPGSNTNGGLYEDIVKGQMVEEFDAFCFAPHKTGDTGIVYGESSSYAGYHVMYFVGEGGQYSDQLVESELRNADLSAWLEELTGSYTTRDGFGMHFVG
ncbi:MAG: peptidylprolyl isomerase [Oscillospiraceae bacterium]|nr:peptidylprolyl isomerase [Oscillospiraceae bacterium]